MAAVKGADDRKLVAAVFADWYRERLGLSTSGEEIARTSEAKPAPARTEKA